MKDKYHGRSSYALASKWLALIRSEARWEPAREPSRAFFRPAGWAVGKLVDWKSRRRESIAAELLPRFGGVMTQTLIVAGRPVADQAEDVVKWALHFNSAVVADPKAACVPELFWKSAASFGAIGEPAFSQLRLKFHLRALLDELPSSDERGALREFVYGGAGSLSGNLAQAYSLRRSEIASGLEIFAAYLHGHRKKVERLTSGAIPQASLSSLSAAQDLLLRAIGVNQ